MLFLGFGYIHNNLNIRKTVPLNLTLSFKKKLFFGILSKKENVDTKAAVLN